MVAFYEGAAPGCAAIERVLANGIPAAALEFLDAGTLAAAGLVPGWCSAGSPLPRRVRADGSVAEAQAAAG